MNLWKDETIGSIVSEELWMSPCSSNAREMALENGRQIGSKMSIQGTESRESLLVFVVRFLVKDELEEVKSVFLNKIKDEVGQVVW